jgi:plasmid stabilization system protein ParE
MNIEILDDAQEDIASGMFFYESQQYGAGEYFLDSISSDIESLHLYAGIHAVRYGCHYLHAKRFPYTIYYTVHEHTIRIVAVLDDRQHPAKTHKRLIK